VVDDEKISNMRNVTMMRRSTLPCAADVTEILIKKVKMNVVYGGRKRMSYSSIRRTTLPIITERMGCLIGMPYI